MKISFFVNILAIGAHPDDIEYGCGGALIKYKNKGANIYLLVLTGGEESGGFEVRKNEQICAANFLSAKLFWGGFKDTQLPMNKELISKIDEIIKETSPDIVFVNYPDDAHQDHRVAADGAIAACRYLRRVLFYEDYTTRNFEPNVFIEITDVLEEKVKLLSFHKSQVNKEYPTGLDMLESVRSIASFRGFQGKVRYAEGFVSLRYLIEI